MFGHLATPNEVGYSVDPVTQAVIAIDAALLAGLEQLIQGAQLGTFQVSERRTCAPFRVHTLDQGAPVNT